MTYEEMDIGQQLEFIGKLCHAVSKFPTAFTMAQEIITLAESRGVYKDTTFGSEVYCNHIFKERDFPETHVACIKCGYKP